MFLLCSARLCDVANNFMRPRGDRASEVDYKTTDVEGLKYLPARVVNDLRLTQLGFLGKTILFRDEYCFTLKALEGRQNHSGEIIVTGHPGIGTSLLQKDKDNLAHILIHPGKSVCIIYPLLHRLGRGLPVALQCDTVFFIFREDGVEMHGADSMGLCFVPEKEHGLSRELLKRANFHV